MQEGQCKISYELSQWTNDARAGEILHQNNIYVLPDFLANAGE
jgi:glutamate dehydrogenase/leucine dehydrogenase